jgi:hypothetical protein
MLGGLEEEWDGAGPGQRPPPAREPARRSLDVLDDTHRLAIESEEARRRADEAAGAAGAAGLPRGRPTPPPRRFERGRRPLPPGAAGRGGAGRQRRRRRAPPWAGQGGGGGATRGRGGGGYACVHQRGIVSSPRTVWVHATAAALDDEDQDARRNSQLEPHPAIPSQPLLTSLSPYPPAKKNNFSLYPNLSRVAVQTSSMMVNERVPNFSLYPNLSRVAVQA